MIEQRDDVGVPEGSEDFNFPFKPREAIPRSALAEDQFLQGQESTIGVRHLPYPRMQALAKKPFNGIAPVGRLKSALSRH